MAKSLSIEDGNLQTKTILSSRTRVYKDIDLTFEKKLNGDVYAKNDAAAVKQSIKNLLLTNKTEKPFSPRFGGNLYNLLFELDTDFDIEDLEEVIGNAVSNYEPRGYVRNVNARHNPATNSVDITIVFQVISTSEVAEVNVSVTRLR